MDHAEDAGAGAVSPSLARTTSPHPQLHPRPRPLRLEASALSSASASSASVVASSTTIKCPELVLRGVDLQQMRVELQTLQKKGKLFDSKWQSFVVGIYGNVLFYYENLQDLPRGIVPLIDCTVKAVDRIYRTVEGAGGNASTTPIHHTKAEECGPCFKVTSRARRVLLFRCPSEAVRDRWIARIREADGTQEVADFTGMLELVNAVAEAEAEAEAEDEAKAEERTEKTRVTPGETTSPSADASESEEKAAVTDVNQPAKSSSAMLKAIMSARHSLDTLPRADATPATRHSLDEVQLARIRRRRSRGQSESGAAQDVEMSQMLRDAMVIMKKQNEEISQLRTALSEDGKAQMRDSAPARTSDAVESVADSIDLEIGDDFMKVTDEISGFVRVDRAASEATAQSRGEMDHSLNGDAFDLLAVPLTGSSSNTEILQRQAMELAEIARSLQLQFQHDVLASVNQANAAASASDSEDFENDERLSDFNDDDAKFLESNGLMDTVHFITPKRPVLESVQEPELPSIHDDCVSEVRDDLISNGDRHQMEKGCMDSKIRRTASARVTESSVTPTKTDKSAILPRTNSADTYTFRLVNAQTLEFPATAQDLESLLVGEDMSVVSSLLQTATRDEKTSLLLPLLRTFGAHDCLSRLLRWAIETEVSSVINVATLFRSDDYASRLVSTYSKAVGARFIRIALTHPVREICRIRYADVDLTPQSGADGEQLTQRRAENMMRGCQLIVDAIIRNKNNIPLSYFHICSYLNDRVISRFDGSMEGLTVSDPATLTQSVIGGFLFLRFVCPAITAPHLHDLVHKEPDADTKRVLVQMTRLLFKTATSVYFDEKQPQFRILNPFIERNTTRIQNLFKGLAVAPKRDFDECIAVDSQYVFTDISSKQLVMDMNVVESVAEKNVDAMQEKLSDSPQTAADVRTAIVHAAKRHDPFLSQRMQKPKKLNIKFFTGFHKMVRKYSDT